MSATLPAPHRTRHRELVLSTAMLSAIVFVACRRAPEAEVTDDATPSAQASAARAGASSAEPAGQEPGDGAPPDKWAKNQIPPEPLPAVPPPAEDAGPALETPLYSFLLENVIRCAPPDAGAGGGGEAGTTAQADAGPSFEMVPFGFEVRIRARAERLFVSPRDVKVKHGGIIFTSLLRSAGPRCEPRLKPMMVMRGMETAGFVVFEIPADETRQLELAYEPTRWGGAPPVTMHLPQCLDCANDTTKSKPKHRRPE